MTDEKDKWVQAVAKLNRLTQEGTLKWVRMEPPQQLTQGTHSVIVEFYTTTYQGRNLAIYLLRYRNYYNEEDYEWSAEPRLVVCTPTWEPEWPFPEVAGIHELFSSVRFQVADVTTLLDDILKRDP
jgi:hypothetical protein